MGVERWFERKASHLRGKAKIHLDRSHFIVSRNGHDRGGVNRGVRSHKSPLSSLHPSVSALSAARSSSLCLFF